MIENYFPVVVQFFIALSVAVGGLVTSVIIGKRARRTAAKDAAYECGKDPIGSSQPRFSVKFYVIAMIFILFDIEVIFMYPWALSYLELVGMESVGMQAFWAMFIFILIVEVGHLYAYKEGVFDWNR